MLTKDEQRRVLHDWNHAAAAFVESTGVQSLFEVQARQRPEAIALCLGEQTISYAELNRQANRLAHYLIDQGVGAEVMVGVAVERSFAMVVSLLAVLKAGGAYVPLDPQYPRERLLHMLEDSAVRLVVCQSSVPLPLPEHIERLDLDRLDGDLQGRFEHNPQVQVDPQNLAYVIYTSGSTGKPKGVAINHAALTEFSSIAAGYSQLTQADRVLQFATLNFDGFVEQLYPALTHGATVILRGPELWDSARLYEEIITQGITLADLPTAYWNLFLLDCLATGPRAYGALRQVHIGGEAMPLEGPAQWLKAGLGHVRLLNTYGPTEATVVSSVLDCTSASEIIGATASPIGRALPGRALYVLDRDLNLAPLGAVGELYIASHRGLARAYLNRALLTAERFVPDPFGDTGERLYRTGDLARCRADGVIEYVMSFAQLPIASIREAGQHAPLSYAQERQWFLWQLDPDSAAYHVPGALRLNGRLDKAALQRSFDTLVARHESLRTRLHLEERVSVRPAEPVLIARVDALEATLQQQVEAEIARPFDLQQGPLLRVTLMRLAQDLHVLVLVQHHIVSDGGRCRCGR